MLASGWWEVGKGCVTGRLVCGLCLWFVVWCLWSMVRARSTEGLRSREAQRPVASSRLEQGFDANPKPVSSPNTHRPLHPNMDAAFPDVVSSPTMARMEPAVLSPTATRLANASSDAISTTRGESMLALSPMTSSTEIADAMGNGGADPASKTGLAHPLIGFGATDAGVPASQSQVFEGA